MSFSFEKQKHSCLNQRQAILKMCFKTVESGSYATVDEIEYSEYQECVSYGVFLLRRIAIYLYGMAEIACYYKSSCNFH